MSEYTIDDIDEQVEEDVNLIDFIENSRLPKTYTIRANPFDLSDKKFYSRYRFDKESVKYIVDLIKNYLPNRINKRGLPIDHYLMVLITLHFFGRNVHQDDSAALHGVSQASVSRIVKCVSRAIALLLPQFIKFPNTVEDITETKKKFHSIAGFPCVIGAIDCTHVKIKCPAKKLGPELAGHYINRKQFYSINVQIVCDANYKIIDIVSRWRGSIHDSRIWNSCLLKRNLEQRRAGLLLGDAGYPCSKILLTPISNPATVKEQNYNRAHISTRGCIERLNGQIKSKFRSIFERLRVDLDTAKAIIVACAVLHNISKDRNCNFLEPRVHYRQQRPYPEVEEINGEAFETGRLFRTAFINKYF